MNVGNRIKELRIKHDLTQKELAKEIDNVVRRLTRALSRDLSLKNEREIENNYKLQKEYLDERIEALKEYLRK